MAENLFGQEQWARRGEADVVAAAAVSAALPVGSIVAYWGLTAPSGWLLCDGNPIPAQYAALIALVGPNTPNLKGRVVVGYNAAETEFDTLGETGGSKTSTAPHTHNLNSHTHQHDHGHTISDPSHSHTVNSHNHGGGTGVHSHTAYAAFNDVNNPDSQGYPFNNNHQRFRTTDRADNWPVASGALSNAGVANTFEAPGTNGVATGITTTAATASPANSGGPSLPDTQGSSASAASGNLQPYAAVPYIIRAAA